MRSAIFAFVADVRLATAICSTATSGTNRIVEINSGSKFDGISLDRKSTRLNSSHLGISYAVFCWKNKRVRGHAHAVDQRHQGHSNRVQNLFRRCRGAGSALAAAERAGAGESVSLFRFFFLTPRPPPRSTLFPYTTLFR